MAYKEMQDLVLDSIGDTSDATRAKVKKYLNHIKNDVIGRHEWPFQEASSTISLTTSTAEYDVPADMDIIKKIIVEEGELIYLPPDVFFKKFPNYDDADNSDTPEAYTLWNDKILIGPSIPDEAETASIFYFATVSDMSGDDDTPGDWPAAFHHVLVDGAYWMAIRSEAYVSEIQEAKANYEAGILRMAQKLLPKQADRFVEVYSEDEE